MTQLIYGKRITALSTFATRAAFVDALGSLSPTVGSVVHAGGIAYRYTGSGTAIADLPGWVPDGEAMPDHWAANVTPGTTDMTAALAAYFAYDGAKSAGGGAYLLTSMVTVPNGGSAGGALRLKWGGAASTQILSLGADFSFDRLEIDFGAIANCKIVATTGLNGNFLHCHGTVESDGTFVEASNVGLSIGHVKFENATRGMAILNDIPASGGWIGLYECSPFIRGFRSLLADGWRVDRIHAHGRATNALVSPGHNAVLIESSSDWSIGEIVAYDAGEHNVRIGGAGGFGSHRWVIGSISGGRAGGCMYKLNASGQLCRDWTIGRIEGVANSTGTGRNREFARISGSVNGQIGILQASKEAASAQSWMSLLSLNNIDGLFIGSASGMSIDSELLRLDGEQDNQAGPIKNVFLGHLAGQNFTHGVAVSCPTGSGQIGDINVASGTFLGTYTNIINISDDAAGYTGQIRLSGYCASGYTQSGVGATDPIFVDVTAQNGRRVAGRGNAANLGVYTFSSPAPLATSATNDTIGTALLKSEPVASADGANGAGLAFARPSSDGRRAALIQVFQDGTSASGAGLDFYMGAGVTSTDNVTKQFRMRNNGDFDLLKAGGGIKLVQPNGTVRRLTVNDSGALVVT